MRSTEPKIIADALKAELESPADQAGRRKVQELAAAMVNRLSVSVLRVAHAPSG